MTIVLDKTTAGLSIPVRCVIRKICVQDGDVVEAGQVLFKIEPQPDIVEPATAAPPVEAARERRSCSWKLGAIAGITIFGGAIVGVSVF